MHIFSDSFHNQTKLSLDEQVKSFEDSYKAAPEVKRLMMVCANTGPFGAVLDGLNVAGGNIDTQRVSTCQQNNVLITQHFNYSSIFGWTKLKFNIH